MPGAITGVVGQIKWHYYVAAAIHGYHVTRSDVGQWSLTATVVLSDAYKMAQQPLIFVAPTAQGEWRWPILERPHIADGALTARLGPPEE